MADDTQAFSGMAGCSDCVWKITSSDNVRSLAGRLPPGRDLLQMRLTKRLWLKTRGSMKNDLKKAFCSSRRQRLS
jgi:hypothetical protein